jgi:hypothetical protein
MWPFGSGTQQRAADGAAAGVVVGGASSDERGRTRPAAAAGGGEYGLPSEEERMEAIVALANLAENPETHDGAFSGLQGSRAFELFVALIKAPTAAEQREGFRALSCLALARSRAAATTGGGAIDASLMALLLQKAVQAMEVQPDGRECDEEVAFHAARALSLLSTNQANRRLIVEHGGLPIMYALHGTPPPHSTGPHPDDVADCRARRAAHHVRRPRLTTCRSLSTPSPRHACPLLTDGGLSRGRYRYALARQADTDIQAEATTVLANVTVRAQRGLPIGPHHPMTWHPDGGLPIGPHHPMTWHPDGGLSIGPHHPMTWHPDGGLSIGPHHPMTWHPDDVAPR